MVLDESIVKGDELIAKAEAAGKRRDAIQKKRRRSGSEGQRNRQRGERQSAVEASRASAESRQPPLFSMAGTCSPTTCAQTSRGCG